MIKYQNYKHYKLPITINPLDYGKLITKIDDLYIIQINKTNIALIAKHEKLNHVKIYKEGDLIFEYKDHITDETTFVRSLENKKFTYQNGDLIYIEKPII